MNPEPQVVQAMRFGHPAMLWLLLGVPLGGLLVALLRKTRARARTTWAGALFSRLNPFDDPGRDRWRVALFLLGYALVVVAMARPQWGGEMVMMKRRGIDVLVAVDVSNSMLAEDLRPNRLAAAKRAIADLVGKMGGDRLGLIAFAGDAYTVCPLTLDHGTVLLLLDSLNPGAVSFGGTNLEEAIRRARASFVKEERRYKALVLVTDGESTVGDPIREAQQAAEEGVVIYCIGIGSPDGQPIPLRDDSGNITGYRRDPSGQVVNSRLQAAELEKIATATHGRAFRASPQGLELGAVLGELQALEKKDLQGQIATNYEERYQWPLAMAAAVLALEMLIPNRRRKVATT